MTPPPGAQPSGTGREGPFFAAVDVGTGSARAGIFDASGRLLGRAVRRISLRGHHGGAAVQSSGEIWNAVCEALIEARERLGIAAADVAGIGFGATCSLVLREHGGAPVAAGEDGDPAWDVMAWCDHRAEAESLRAQAVAARLFAEGRGPAPGSAGLASPEMQLPRMMRLSTQPGLWSRATAPLDLPDFLTWRATGTPRRGSCSLSAKWGWSPRDGWPLELLEELGIPTLPARILTPGGPARPGEAAGRLTPRAAAELGLTEGCAVAAAHVDAYAGAAGLLLDLPDEALHRTAALIAGTSSCIMHLSPDPLPAPGLWGPYLDSVAPDLWAAEGGQSAAGVLLDHMLRIGGAGEPDQALHERVAATVRRELAAHGPGWGGEIHVAPDFNGARTPEPDPAALGAIHGLTLERGFEAGCKLWWRAAVALALGVSRIVEHMGEQGRAIERLHLGGGHGRSPLLGQLYADATGLPVALGGPGGGMLRGSALSAMAAAGRHPSLRAAALACPLPRQELRPDPARQAQLARDREAQAAMAACAASLRALRPPRQTFGG